MEIRRNEHPSHMLYRYAWQVESRQRLITCVVGRRYFVSLHMPSHSSDMLGITVKQKYAKGVSAVRI